MPRVKAPSRGASALAPRWRVDAGEYVTAVAWVADDSLVALSTAEGRVAALDGEKGSPRWSSVLHPGGALALAASPDGTRVLSGGQDGSAALVDGASGELVARWQSPQRRWVEHVAWAPRGGLGAASMGRVARVIDGAGEAVFETEAHAASIGALAFSPDGSRLAVASYGGVTIWDIAARSKSLELAWKGSLISMAWSPDGAVIACGSQDATVHFWRLASGRDSEMSGFPTKPRALAWDARGSWLATGGSSDIALWNFAGKGPEGSAPTLLQETRSLATALAFHPRRGVLAAGYLSGLVASWDVRNPTAPNANGKSVAEVTSLAWRRDGAAFVSGDAVGVVTRWTPIDP